MPGRLSSREKVLAALTASIAGVYLLARLLVFPAMDRWHETNAALTQARAHLLKSVKIARLAEADEVKRLVRPAGAPGLSPIASLLQDIETAAQQQVIIRRFQPSSASPQRVRPATGAGAQPVTRLQVQIDCVGKLTGLMAFFERIETAHSLTRIRHFYLTPEGGDEQRLNCRLEVERLLAYEVL